MIYSFGLYFIYRLLRDGPAAAAEGSGDSTLAGCLPLRCRPRLKRGNDRHGTISLALFWAAVIAVAIESTSYSTASISVWVSCSAPREIPTLREEMMDSISPFWDGNETWLVVVSAHRCSRLFPLFTPCSCQRSISRSCCCCLDLSSVAWLSSSATAAHAARIVGLGFFLGSTMATFVQGAAVGAMIRGIPVEKGQYSGGRFEWLAPLPVLTGIGSVLGYALLGAGWLVLKTTGEFTNGHGRGCHAWRPPCSSCWLWPP